MNLSARALQQLSALYGMTPEEIQEDIILSAYANAHLSNEDITLDMVRQASADLKQGKGHPMTYIDALAVLEDRRYACFAYAAHAYSGAVAGMILVWSKEGHVQMTYDPANHTWNRIGVIDDLGLESLLEASYWETGLLDTFKSV